MWKISNIFFCVWFPAISSHLSVCAANLHTSIQTGTIVRVNNVTCNDSVCSDTAVVWTVKRESRVMKRTMKSQQKWKSFHFSLTLAEQESHLLAILVDDRPSQAKCIPAQCQTMHPHRCTCCWHQRKPYDGWSRVVCHRTCTFRTSRECCCHDGMDRDKSPPDASRCQSSRRALDMSMTHRSSKLANLQTQVSEGGKIMSLLIDFNTHVYCVQMWDVRTTKS